IFDAVGHYLSTTAHSYKIVRPFLGLDGRSVGFSYLAQIDTRLYDQSAWVPFDGAAVATVQGKEMQWTTPVPIRSGANALIRQTRELDDNGRLVRAVDLGHVKDD